MKGNSTVEKQWKHNGLTCVVSMHPFGHRCGYVGVPKTHELYKHGYETLSINVHGGITYANGGPSTVYPIKADLWWFGFDCGHWGDKPDPKFIPPELSSLSERDGIVRTLAYCVKECNKMADQLVRLDKET